MTRLRHLPALVVALALMLPAAAVSAQEPVATSPAPAAVAEATDTRVEELRALVPEFLAGLPLREELQIATGEQLAAQMTEAERVALKDMLVEQGRSFADYVAANAFLSLTDTRVAVVQAHRVRGIDASETVDTWIEILGFNAQQPHLAEELIAGREVMLVSDDAQPGVPRLHLFASGDVVWMVVAEELALAEEAVRSLSAASEPIEPEE